MKHIPESVFRRYTQKRRKELAEMVGSCGMTIAQIACATRMKWDTVNRIAQGKAVRSESQDRVRCFLEICKKHEKDID